MAAIGYVMFTCLMAQLKSYYLFKNRKAFRKLVLDLDQATFKEKNNAEKVIINNVLGLFWNIKTALIVVSFVAVLSSVSVPLFYPKETGMPIQAWYPFDVSEGTSYVLAYLHQAVSIIYISGVNIYVDVIVAGFCTIIGLQCDLLCERILMLGENEDDRRNKDNFVNCIQHHFTILE
ncbi:uncharacterized protein LOC115877943 [Sitophilus oryzae]|uniref:Uncharacterized protein LOC115877943 n=1 Tax=Sitophilus oryzae TaxID=7048 RepID=A0A6J2XFN1_SITOR|nr:uncharacterized protein LOC115877943 [Sitophilus oryzae]